MSATPRREPVRLGLQQGRSIYEQAKGLHGDVAGLIHIAGGPPDDPLVIFEEHGMDRTCRYFELERAATLEPGLNPTPIPRGFAR